MFGDLPPGNQRGFGSMWLRRILPGASLFASATVSLAQLPSIPANRPPVLQPLSPDTGRVPADKRYMPSSINEPLMSMTIQVVKETPQESVYRSRHFEFSSPVKLGANSMKEICRTFESTYELVSKLPWGINPWPEDGKIFHAKLYLTRADYIASGAPQWSAGVYSIREGIFRIPFEEVGLKSRGSDFYLGGAINNDTITHEVTHQMMHEYLRFMPIWLSEGLAEYTANLPYLSGRYNVAGAVEGFKQMRREKTKRRGYNMRPVPTGSWIGAPDLWNFTTSIVTRRPIADPANPTPKTEPSPSTPGTRSFGTGPDQDLVELPNRYFSGHALAFYFMHFDGDGKATRLKRYFDAIHEERKLWAPFQAQLKDYETAVVKYLTEWEAFKKAPGVIDLGGGMLRYPTNLTPPKAPQAPVGPDGLEPSKVCAKHLGILLDGRTLAQLDEDVRTAFAKAEIPLR